MYVAKRAPLKKKTQRFRRHISTTRAPSGIAASLLRGRWGKQKLRSDSRGVFCAGRRCWDGCVVLSRVRGMSEVCCG